MTAPAEHGDTPGLTEQERESWVEFIVNVATFVMGAMAEQTVGARDRGDDWHERAAEEALDLFMPHVRELLSARSAATPDTAAQALRDAADAIDQNVERGWREGDRWAARWLRDRATRLDPGTRDQADQGGRA